MADRLPPLNALRAFEAAARLGSFAKAAEELHVTAAAVSHQVKQLEDSLGVHLFRRLPRGLVASEAAVAAQPLLADAFRTMGDAVERMRSRQMAGRLTITVSPAFAVWLIPLLEGFRERYPDIDLLLDATDQLVDLRRDRKDIGIRYGQGSYPGLFSERISVEREEFPVCSPLLLEGAHPLRTPEDLRHHRLLHVEWWGDSEQERWPGWKMWLKAAGVEDVDWRKGLKFTNASLAIQAAREGHGVALGSSLTVAHDLRAGRLVRPFELAIGMPDTFGYYLVCLEGEETRPKIAAFRDWVKQDLSAQLAG